MRTIQVNQVIDESKYNSFHLRVVVLCLFVIICDGYDLVVYGTVVSVLMKEWNLTPVVAGMLGSYALIGMLLGALIFAPLADRIGRKTVVLMSLTVFSAFTGLVGFTTTPNEFGIYRFVAGLGLGGAMPVCITLVTEYMPKSVRSTMVAIMFCGWSVGSIIAAGIGIFLIPAYGWKIMFWLGAVPLILVPILYIYLPESATFYLKRGQLAQIASLVKSVDPEYQRQNDDKFDVTTVKISAIPVVNLFQEGRALSTIMFWVASLMCLLMIYAIAVWLPKLMQNAGYSVGSSLWFLLVSNIGAIVGAVLGGWLSDRFEGKKVLVAYFFLAFVSINLLGLNVDFSLLSLFVALSGATTVGTQIVANAYIAQYYPLSMRSTGIGWALGIGRSGAIIGPTFGGMLLALNASLQMNFLAFAIPALIAAVAIALVQTKQGHAWIVSNGAKQQVAPLA